MSAVRHLTPSSKAPSASLQPSSFSRREWVFRAVIATALCVAAVLAWWSLKVRLLPLQKQARELAVAVSHLATEVDELDRQWPQARQEQVAARLVQAHSQLFSNQAALEIWLSKLDQQAVPLRLETKTALGQSVAKLSGAEEVAVIPTTVSVDARPPSSSTLNESGYQRVLRLTQQLNQSSKRADLAELTVRGGTNSVSSATLVYHLWAGEGAKP